MNEMKQDRWFAVCGDNGFAFTTQEFVIVSGIRKLRNVSIMEFQNRELASYYARAAYVSRFMMRNYSLAIAPQIIINQPADYLWIDPDFEAREGGKNMLYFPGISM